MLLTPKLLAYPETAALIGSMRQTGQEVLRAQYDIGYVTGQQKIMKSVRKFGVAPNGRYEGGVTKIAAFMADIPAPGEYPKFDFVVGPDRVYDFLRARGLGREDEFGEKNYAVYDLAREVPGGIIHIPLLEPDVTVDWQDYAKPKKGQPKSFPVLKRGTNIVQESDVKGIERDFKKHLAEQILSASQRK